MFDVVTIPKNNPSLCLGDMHFRLKIVYGKRNFRINQNLKYKKLKKNKCPDRNLVKEKASISVDTFAI